MPEARGAAQDLFCPDSTCAGMDFLQSATVSSLDRATINECLRLASEYVQIRSKICVKSTVHLKLLDKLLDQLGSESSQILTIDGVKAIFDEDSWVLVRPSNTEDAIRISVESKANNAQSLYKKIMEKVNLIYERVK